MQTWLREHPRELFLFLLMVFLVFLISIRSPVFLTLGNWDDIINDTSILILVALAEMTVILTGGIDLSVSSNIALTGMSVALLSKNFPDLPFFLIPLSAMLIGLTLGSFNGFFISVFRIPPIVVTLGTLSIFRGLAFVLSGGEWVSSHEMTETFLNFPKDRFLGLTYLVWFAIFGILFFSVFLRRSSLGRQIYALGGSLSTSLYTGIPIQRTQFSVYCITGTVAGLAGYLWVSRYTIASTEQAVGFELQVIAACVIGGVSIAGGIGTVFGCVLGAVFLGILNNALPIIQISPFWQTAVVGISLLLAIILNSIQAKHSIQKSKKKQKKIDPKTDP